MHNPEGIEKPDAKYQDDDYTQDRLDGLGHWPSDSRMMMQPAIADDCLDRARPGIAYAEKARASLRWAAPTMRNRFKNLYLNSPTVRGE